MLAIDWEGGEPSLEDLLAEPIIRLLMRRDRVSPDEIRRLLGGRKRRAASGPRRAAAEAV